MKSMAVIPQITLSWVLFVFVGLSHAQENVAPEELLKQIDGAFAALNYDGVFSYFNGSDMASLRVVHKLTDGQPQERLVHLNGAPREILRHGDEVICLVMPGDDLIALEQSIPAGPFARAFVRPFDDIDGSYEVVDSGFGRVAGRAARRIAVLAKDRFRFGYRLWVDEENGLVLRWETVDQFDRQLEIFMFNQIRFGEQVTDAALEPQTPEGSKVNHLSLQPAKAIADDQSAPNSQTQGWRTDWLPPGFAMATKAEARPKPVSGAMVNSLMYSDGLASFSVFIEPMPDAGAAAMVSTNGATVALTHGLGTDDGTFLLTLVGEIPVATAQKIVESVVLAGQ